MVVINLKNLPVIGEVIKNRRKALALTQGELAERVGITQTYLSLIENGSKVPTLGKLLQVLGEINLELSLLEQGG
jgi:XRE family transcriptional regulator, regulator of sulfur utilization